MSSTYETFIEMVRQIGRLESVESLLDWDQETKMPPNGLNARAEQLSTLARLVHEHRTSPELGEALQDLNGQSDDPVRATNIRETRRLYDRAVKVPADLVAKIASVSAHAKSAWAVARKDSNFAAFAPHLDELLKLKCEVADLVGHNGDRYDALLSEFEPGAKAEEIANVFAELRGPLSEFVSQIAAASTRPDPAIITRHFPWAAQEQFARTLATAIGFDFQSGRLDASVHPFCSGTTPNDVRLTTRYIENFFNCAIFGTLHEAGHGVYEQGFDEKHMFTPMGSAISLGIHESQSRMWENLVGRSRGFWKHFYPLCQTQFPDSLSDVSMDAFYGAINAVQPSFIRVEADEVTYNLHIILRFELEREMIAGRLAVNDVPEAWNTKTKELLGLTPSNDAEGCLQDIHWSMGTFGYFPTYALGNLYAAQFFATARNAIPDLDDRIARGDFKTLLDWLRENIYRHGQRYTATELVEVVTGSPLSVTPFIQYVRAKFSPVYGLE